MFLNSGVVGSLGRNDGVECCLSEVVVFLLTVVF